MNDTIGSLDASPLDPRLEQIIERAIDRLQDGEPIDSESLIARHPEHAAELRELLPMVETMVRIGAVAKVLAGSPLSPNPSLPRGVESDMPSLFLPRGGKAEVPRLFPPSGGAIGMLSRSGESEYRIGDFRIVRELGRGGMGVVYEAEQISLGRRVALKVLPFAAMLDRQQLARFKNEARAAATLDHPNIVAIYSVGCDRGVHYYAMQLVEGRSLAEIIAHAKPAGPPSPEEAAFPAPSRCPLPKGEVIAGTAAADTARAAVRTMRATGRATFSTASPVVEREFHRNVARLGVQAAAALDHAHRHGILHRDVKPANLLVDDGGKLWITDFGLARVEADAGMTMTGDLLGTLRYMSPEQAMANRVVIDHRCDIYSLGATLYELLALQPAFTETDRAKLLQHIAFEEPCPLRRINGQIPVELETIVLKAMAKRREERYQTAEELADDLQAFLEHRPIKARPPTLANRAMKWSTRHQAVVWTLVFAFVLLSGILAVSMTRVHRAQQHAVAALEETADLLYATDMTLAFQAHEKGWNDEVQPILDRYVPKSERDIDRRGFEWRLLQALTEPPTCTTLAGHQGPANELAVFPDGRTIASVGSDGTLRIWDPREGKSLRTIRITDEELHSVAISPDGRFAAVGSTAVFLCDLTQAGGVSEIFRNDFSIEAIAFSPDGSQLILGTRYDAICLISLNGEVIKSMPSGSRCDSLEFVPDRPLVLIPNAKVSAERPVLRFAEVWEQDLSGMQQRLEGSKGRSNITVVRPSPCGNFIVAGEERRSKLLLYQLRTGELISATSPHRDWLRDLAFSPDRKSIAVCYQDGMVKVFAIELDSIGRPRFLDRPQIFSGHRGEAKSVRFVDGTTLATCGADGLVQLWNINRGLSLRFDAARLHCSGLAVSPDGRKLLYVSRNQYLVADTESGHVLSRFIDPEAVFRGAQWSLSGERAAVGAPGSIMLLDSSGIAAGEIKCKKEMDINAFAISPAGDRVVFVQGRHLKVVGCKDGQTIDECLLTQIADAVAYSSDGSLIACGGGQNGWLRIYRSNDLLPLVESSCKSDVRCVAFSIDDSFVITGHRDSVVRIWDARTGRLQHELIGHEQEVHNLSISPDGQTLISGGEDGTARIWSIKHRCCLGIVFRHTIESTEAGCKVSLSGNGEVLAAARRDTSPGSPDVQLWRVKSIATD